ncbi:hypothetical protein CH253_26735 [Rhodococcus sp. 06-156-3C]|nr:hypothetical protein CH253_26735 [Rhodococcus sp. 06-156-3C]OZD19053.1 hypothetical protein CH280_05115 [Rhodococcus sp. 06-156-4C]OZD20907.1 hypothetical protein CH248_11610 [Rhodococcus sp. 06-156-4a]OZD33639.1 hypothetical protein CH284_18675 [Rhodococcus sp. 06-156-3]
MTEGDVPSVYGVLQGFRNKLSPSDRKAMARKAEELGFTTRQIASMQGVDQKTASNDTRGVTSEENSSSNTPPSTFTCSSCEKRTRWSSRVEHETR